MSTRPVFPTSGRTLAREAEAAGRPASVSYPQEALGGGGRVRPAPTTQEGLWVVSGTFDLRDEKEPAVSKQDEAASETQRVSER